MENYFSRNLPSWCEATRQENAYYSSWVNKNFQPHSLRNEESWLRKEPNLTEVCPRCGGSLILEKQPNLTNDAGQLQLIFLRCIQCGNVIYPEESPGRPADSIKKNIAKPRLSGRSQGRTLTRGSRS